MIAQVLQTYMPARTSRRSETASLLEHDLVASKPVAFRNLASADLESAAAHYVADADPDVAMCFVDAVEAADRWVGRNPGLGSPRYAYELTIPDLRAVTVGRFPYVMFYVERPEDVDVWRLLHTSRDIPATLHVGPST